MRTEGADWLTAPLSVPVPFAPVLIVAVPARPVVVKLIEAAPLFVVLSVAPLAKLRDPKVKLPVTKGSIVIVDEPLTLTLLPIVPAAAGASARRRTPSSERATVPKTAPLVRPEAEFVK